MNKDKLIELGLSEEQAKAVIDGFGIMIPKSRLDEQIDKAKALEEQLKGRDSQLEELSKVDANALETRIKELQEQNNQVKSEYEKKLADTVVNAELKSALNGKVHDLDIALGLINREALKIEDGKVVSGLDEQLTSLKEAKSYLFVNEAPAPVQPTFTGLKPVGGIEGGGTEGSLGSSFAQQLNKSASPSVSNPWDNFKS